MSYHQSGLFPVVKLQPKITISEDDSSKTSVQIMDTTNNNHSNIQSFEFEKDRNGNILEWKNTMPENLAKILIKSLAISRLIFHFLYFLFFLHVCF